MRSYPNAPRLEVGMDFGGGSGPVGGVAVAAGRVFFQFDAAFASHGVNPSPVRLRLNDELQEGPRELERLPGLLHDSLPDGWARLVLDRHIRASGYDPGSLTVLDRLAFVGGSGAGAMTYLQTDALPLDPPEVDFDTAAALVRDAPEEDDADRVRDALTLMRSLGGARPKANVWRLGKEFSTQMGAGARPWIVKFHARQDGPEAGAVEYAYSLMARAAGITMPEAALLPSQDTGGYFAVERFDRPGTNGRLHVHSLGGLLHASCENSALGYVELMKVTGSLTQPRGADQSSIAEQIRRMAFNVFGRNRDDHVKNHSFLMDEEGAWQCAPAFDLTHSNLPEHTLMVGEAGREPTVADMMSVVRAVEFPERRAKDLVLGVRDVVAEWPSFARTAGVGRVLIDDIAATLNGGQAVGNRGAAHAALAHARGLGR